MASNCAACGKKLGNCRITLPFDKRYVFWHNEGNETIEMPITLIAGSEVCWFCKPTMGEIIYIHLTTRRAKELTI